MVASDTVLTQYDPEKELRLATDISLWSWTCFKEALSIV